MPAIDVHRHLCTPRQFETLASRTSEPRVLGAYDFGDLGQLRRRALDENVGLA